MQVFVQAIYDSATGLLTFTIPATDGSGDDPVLHSVQIELSVEDAVRAGIE